MDIIIELYLKGEYNCKENVYISDNEFYFINEAEFKANK